jgi:Na+/H+-dicarboxylate symporter
MCRTTVNVSGDLVIAALVSGTVVQQGTVRQKEAHS